MKTSRVKPSFIKTVRTNRYRRGISPGIHFYQLGTTLSEQCNAFAIWFGSLLVNHMLFMFL